MTDTHPRRRNNSNDDDEEDGGNFDCNIVSGQEAFTLECTNDAAALVSRLHSQAHSLSLPRLLCISVCVLASSRW